ncbi:hypothetical protein DOT_4091 [Desulfosporosinus sp. OT]|nr:hypothetical protein DOT_4091 [Desulfosporosinus sp. OT]
MKLLSSIGQTNTLSAKIEEKNNFYVVFDCQREDFLVIKTVRKIK